jgi:hypothetical protein
LTLCRLPLESGVGDEKALREIKRLASLGRVRYTDHAWDRMHERGAEPADVTEALLSSSEAVYQRDRRNWKVVGGVDRDGDDLTVVVAIEADLVIITVL